MAPIPEPWEEGEDKEKIRPLDEDDIQLLKTYGLGPYADAIRTVEQELKEKAQRVNDLCGAWKRRRRKTTKAKAKKKRTRTQTRKGMGKTNHETEQQKRRTTGEETTERHDRNRNQAQATRASSVQPRRTS